MTARARLVGWSVLALALAPRAAAAQPASDSAAAAEKLFREGRDALVAGRLDEACPKLAESHRLDPGVGTLLNLGDCYVRANKVASAWATYNEAETLARRQGQRERASFAAARAEELLSRLPYLTIRLTAPPKDATVKRDGAIVGAAALATAIPVDPGAHVVEVSAPGYRPRRETVTVAAGERRELLVPALAALPAPTPPPPPPEAKGSPLRTAGWITAGTGAAVAVTGLVVGGFAKLKNDDARENHCSAVDCEAEGVDAIRSAKTLADVSTVLVVSGGVVAAGGLVLVLVAPRGERRVTATVGLGTVGLSGRF